MASAWGLSWGQAWNGAWGSVDGDSPAPPAVVSVVPPSGGYPSDRGPTPEQKRRSRILHGLEKEVVESVAKRQADALDLDAHQQREELLAELRLQRIEARSLHFEELAKQREALISAEIQRRLQLLIEEEEIVMVMMLAATL